MTRKISKGVSRLTSRVTPLTFFSVAPLIAVALSGLAWAADVSQPARPAAPAQAPEQKTEVELVTVRPGGFEPAEITRPRGKFLLAVENRSGVHELELRLEREAGASEHQVRLPRGRLSWGRMLDLPPGRYTLVEAKHPEWACRINITPN